MLWRRQPLTRQGPLASSGWRNRARAASGYRPGPATLLTVRQVTPLNSHPAALPGQLHVCIVSKGNASGCCVSVSRRCHISA